MTEKIKKESVGRTGEEVTCRHLKKEGYLILERNYKTKYAEIDVVCRKKKELVFVEVRTKTNENFGSPEDTVDVEKIKRLKRSALGYIQKKRYQGPCRIDLVCVVLNKEGDVERLTHHKNITG